MLFSRNALVMTTLSCVNLATWTYIGGMDYDGSGNQRRFRISRYARKLIFDVLVAQT